MKLTAHETITSNEIFTVTSENFELLAIKMFLHQYQHNTVYREYCDILRTDPYTVKNLSSIPFLPIQFFKSRKIITGEADAALVFESSGTTGSINSKHFVTDPLLYEESFLKTFARFYGDPQHKCIIGLLPSYLERKNASLVYMVNELIKSSGNENSGFYLNEFDKLYATLLKNEKNKQQTILIGVTFALLDFADACQMKLTHTTVIETGGMKGRKEELSRETVHTILKQRLGLEVIHSEYGMTELLSQAYAVKDGLFATPPWMSILIRSEDDPFLVQTANEKPVNGGINIIDLANKNSCAFIATDDKGILYPDGSFKVSGRLDHSEMRGCSQMVQ